MQALKNKFSNRTLVIGVLIVSAFLASSSAGITKQGLAEIPQYSFSFLRFVIASLCVLPFFFKTEGHKNSKIRELVPVSLFATINVLFFVMGLTLTTANAGVIIYSAVPLLVAVILFIFFKERLSRIKEWGIFIGFVGVLIITLLPMLEKGNPFAGSLVGNILLTLAIICWSFYTVFSGNLQKKYSYSPFLITCNFIFVSTVVFLPFFLWELYTHFGWWQHVSWAGIFSVVYMALVITVINYMLGQYNIKHGGAVFSSMMFYIKPVFGFTINFFLLGELLTPGFVFGCLIALVGTYLVVRK